MSLDHLWAGWRADYVASVTADPHGGEVDLDGVPQSGSDGGAHDASRASRCVFCRILELDESDEQRYIVHRSSSCVTMLNAFPYASGHMLVMPIRHVDELDRLEEQEATELWQMTRQAAAAAKAAYGVDGLNIGANLGRAAGAGIPSHLHLHVVPRWIGDTNFMTSVAAVRVMPETLSTSWKKLNSAWPR